MIKNLITVNKNQHLLTSAPPQKTNIGAIFARLTVILNPRNLSGFFNEPCN
jgi:hypothetical protein